MTTEQEQAAPEADDSETSGTPAQTVRVPNVHPYAKSGLEHNVIGADALDPGDSTDDEAESSEEPDADPMPDGDADAKVAWVADADEQDDRSARADKVYAWAAESGPSTEYLGELSGRLRTAVYGEPQTQEADGGADLQVAPDSQVPGQVVVSQTAGTGDAENAETGEVTPGGEPLPPVEQEGGTPLDPASSDTPAEQEPSGS